MPAVVLPVGPVEPVPGINVVFFRDDVGLPILFSFCCVVAGVTWRRDNFAGVLWLTAEEVVNCTYSMRLRNGNHVFVMCSGGGSGSDVTAAVTAVMPDACTQERRGSQATCEHSRDQKSFSLTHRLPRL